MEEVKIGMGRKGVGFLVMVGQFVDLCRIRGLKDSADKRKVMVLRGGIRV